MSNETRISDSLNSKLAAWTRAFFSRPHHVAVVFWAGGVLTVSSVIPLDHWSSHALLTLVSIAFVCGIMSIVQLLAGGRLPRWTRHIDITIGIVMISILTAASTTDHVPFADLYVWIAIDAALYCSALAVFGYFAAVGAAYAIALALSRGVTDPWVTWMATIGTVVVAASIVFGLVSVLRMNAKEDPLTGLANRRSWDEHLDGELARSRRTGVPVSVALFDLDGFKAINDTQGHDAGDRLLQELAQTWTAAARGGGDLLARLGGDEFGLLVPGSDEAGIRRLTKRLSQLLPHAVTASVGIATWDRSESASNLLRRADQAMYRAKRQRGTGRPPI